MDLIERVSPWLGSGLLTIEMERAYRLMTGQQLHVSVNGVDVTQRCYCADSIAGFAFVYCRDQRHHDPHVATDHCHLNPTSTLVCTHRLVGRVVIAPGAALV